MVLVVIAAIILIIILCYIQKFSNVLHEENEKFLNDIDYHTHSLYTILYSILYYIFRYTYIKCIYVNENVFIHRISYTYIY